MSMKSHTLVSLLVIASISFAAHAADWSYDFDNPAPATWSTSGITEPPGGTSATFSATIESGYLRMQDPTTAASGGSFSAFGGTTDDFTDVIVEAHVNVAKDTDDDLGIVARVDTSLGNGYFASVDYELGSACITKIAAFHDGTDLACSPLGSLGMADAHHLQLTVTGAATTDLKLEIFDPDTSALLQTVNAIDSSSAYTSGVSGIFMVPKGTFIPEAALNALNGTFDNVSSMAVPEPSTSLLLVVSMFLIGTLGRRR